jgi:hypothetical protein
MLKSAHQGFKLATHNQRFMSAHQNQMLKLATRNQRLKSAHQRPRELSSAMLPYTTSTPKQQQQQQQQH